MWVCWVFFIFKLLIYSSVLALSRVFFSSVSLIWCYGLLVGNMQPKAIFCLSFWVVFGLVFLFCFVFFHRIAVLLLQTSSPTIRLHNTTPTRLRLPVWGWDLPPRRGKGWLSCRDQRTARCCGEPVPRAAGSTGRPCPSPRRGFSSGAADSPQKLPLPSSTGQRALRLRAAAFPPSLCRACARRPPVVAVGSSPGGAEWRAPASAAPLGVCSGATCEGRRGWDGRAWGGRWEEGGGGGGKLFLLASSLRRLEAGESLPVGFLVSAVVLHTRVGGESQKTGFKQTLGAYVESVFFLVVPPSFCSGCVAVEGLESSFSEVGISLAIAIPSFVRSQNTVWAAWHLVFA